MNGTIDRWVTWAIGCGVVFSAAPAEAQLWSALAGKARPHMVVGFDTSVTMGINSACSDCHRDSPGIRVRLDDAKVEIIRTLPMFQDYFYYGGYQYEGCGVAHLAGAPILPNRTNPAASLSGVLGMLGSARECGSREGSLPGGSATVSLTPGGSGDLAVIQALLAGSLTGLSIPPAPAGFPLSPVCSSGPNAGSTINLGNLLQAQFAGMSWPRWNVSIPGSQVDAELCTPLRTGLTAVNNTLIQCVGTATAAAAYWDITNVTCNRGQISVNACANPASPLAPTCVCNQALPGCTSGGAGPNICSFPLQYQARQQIGLCGSYADTTFGNFFRADADNIVNRTAGNPVPCRENVALMFTDGAFGDNGQLPLEANVARTRYYQSPTRDALNQPQSNMFVFSVSNVFNGAADAMATALGNTRYLANNQNQMVSSFARIVNRVYRGSYVGANVTTDRFGTRLVVHSFEVPSGPGNTGEAYLGRPSRVAVFAIDANGVPATTPLYATDWASKQGGAVRTLCVGAPTGGCGLGGHPDCTDNEATLFGALPPTNSTFGNGVPRRQAAPAIPGEGQARAWGHMLGGSTTQPVIVDAPRDIPSGTGAQTYRGFAGTSGARPRMIYVMSNSYLHGIHAGVRTNTPSALGAFGTKRAYDYDDSVAQAGREVFRYYPRSWLRQSAIDPARDICFNDIVSQPLITGQLQARDVQTANNAFRTVLAAAQGASGRGLATLDVTDPSNPRLLAEWLLPVGSSASAEPQLLQWPGPSPVGALVTTSGIGSGRFLRVHNVLDGSVITTRVLGAAGELITEPACIDASGRGTVSVCYVLSSVGELFRVPVLNSGAFGAAATITPAGVVGNGRVFQTRPVVFFGDDGAVNIAFGSGRATDFTPGSDSTDNRFFKAVDASNKSSTAIGQATIANVCRYNNASQSGSISLGSARVVSPPVIAKGVIAFTTYTPGTSGCAAGAAALYAIDYARCTDAYDPLRTAAPSPRALTEAGVPGSPVILRGPESIITQTSQLTNLSRESLDQLGTRGGDRVPYRKLYWRPVIQAQ